MIVDDRVVVIGSANINDRSLKGDRDSEICAVISGGPRVLSDMGGRPWPCGLFAHTFRRQLWEEHLGLEHTGCHRALAHARSYASARSHASPVPALAGAGCASGEGSGAHGGGASHTTEPMAGGCEVDCVRDPVASTVWDDAADANTAALEAVFPDVPRDAFRTFADFRAARGLPVAPRAGELLGAVRGSLVLFPTLFLERETLAVEFGTREFVLPSATFQ
jgi:hypothetical protein